MRFPEKSVKAAKVSALDEEKTLCTVTYIEDELEVDDIRLKASVDGDPEGFFLIPAQDSMVLVQLLDHEMNGFVTFTDQIEKVIYKKGDTEIVFSEMLQSLNSADKIEIKNQSENLKDIIEGIIDIMAMIVVAQGVGPDIPGLAQLKVKLNQLMK